MGKPTGFMEYVRELPVDRAPAERLKDWHEFHSHASEEKLRQLSNRTSKARREKTNALTQSILLIVNLERVKSQRQSNSYPASII